MNKVYNNYVELCKKHNETPKHITNINWYDHYGYLINHDHSLITGEPLF